MALDRGADAVVRYNFMHIGPLEYASIGGHEHAIRFLLSRPVIRQYENFNRCLDMSLYWAAKCGWLRAARLLIEHGAQINPRAKYCRRIPWIAAARHGHVDVFQFLLEHGANLMYNIELAKKTFERAKAKGYSTIVQILEENGLDSAQLTISAGVED